jgi:hypothetical protein
VALRDGLSHGLYNPEGRLEKNQNMSRLPDRIRKSLKNEAVEWDVSISKESPEKIIRLIDKAEAFVARRPPRLPVCLRFVWILSTFLY